MDDNIRSEEMRTMVARRCHYAARIAAFLLVLLSFALIGAGTLAAGKPGLPKDVKADDRDFEAIAKVVELGVLAPAKDGSFRPDETISRADFAVALAKAQKIEPTKPNSPTFVDLPATSPAYPYVEALVKRGIIPVASGKKFAPGDPIKRADLAVWAINALGLSKEAAKIKEPVLLANDEDKVPAYAIGAMTLAYRSNHQLLGYRYGRLSAPLAGATRREAAKALYMMMYPPKRGGTIVTAFTAEPAGFNTLVTSSGATWTIDNIIGDGNTITDENGFYFPRMIKRLPSLENGLIKVKPDGKMEVTFELRKGMKWHDGVEVTAEDPLFQLKVMQDADVPIASNYFEKMVTRAELLDKYTFKIYLDKVQSNARLGSSVYSYYYGWFQLPKHVFEPLYKQAKTTGDWNKFVQEVNNNPIMAGPYKFKEYKQGEYILLEAFDDYYMGRPNIDKIMIKIIPDSSVINAAVLRGDIDFGRYTLQLRDALKLAKEHGDKFNVTFTPTVAYDSIALNFWDPRDLSKPHPAFSDVRVRQAILYAINRTAINTVVYSGQAQVAHAWITPLHAMRDALADPRVHKYPYDPAKARSLLAEAGWKPGPDGILQKDGVKFKFTLLGVAGSKEVEMSEQLVQKMLKDVGIAVDIDNKPARVVIGELAPHRQFDMCWMGWGYGVSDEAADYWSSSGIPSEANSWSGTNQCGWSNPENDRLVAEAAATLDPAKKKDLFARHLALWTKELPHIPLLSPPANHFAKKSIKNFSSGYDNGLGWAIYNWYLQE
ncbi:MAG: peptide/nickel transport system substrate-binding protein [Bacillota bacterium]|nr:peptide/nickel transport system substrate-binding protein [Bacillota bacterium]